MEKRNIHKKCSFGLFFKFQDLEVAEILVKYWRTLTHLCPVGAKVKYCMTGGRLTGVMNVLQ